jgi:L-glutamine-phosphate cytidylyltransferase
VKNNWLQLFSSPRFFLFTQRLCIKLRVKAIILAAGRGSRMKTLTDERPKCLVEFRGKPLLQWQVDALQKAGIEEIAIVSGYKREMLARWELTEFHNPQWAETQMVSSLVCAESWLKEGPCIVSYSDIFYHSSAVQALMNSEARLAITFDPNWLRLWKDRFGDPLLDAETFCLNSDGTLAEIGNKPNAVEEVEGQYMGLLRFSPKGWHEFEQIRKNLSPQESAQIHMTGMLQKIVEQGKESIFAYPYTDPWGEFDTDEDLNYLGNT